MQMEDSGVATPRQHLMRGRRVLLAILLLGGLACKGARSDSTRVGAHSEDSLLLNSATVAESWPVFGRDYGNTRFSPLAQVSIQNVASLRLRWRHDIGSAWQHKPRVWYRPQTWAITPRALRITRMNNKQVSTPIIADGVLYYSGPYSVVAAVNARTGEEIWRYKHPMPRIPLTCCGPQNRGVAFYRGRVYLATLDAHLVALDSRTGKVDWDVTIADSRQGYSANMAPLPVDGQIVVGVGGGEFGIRGLVDAYDAVTGARRWRFWTIPSPEEGGWWGHWSTETSDSIPLPRSIAAERADSARYADSWRHGGGAVWMTPAYDPVRHLLFAGVSNPAPVLDDASRPGDNLYTSSIIALDATTGRLKWHFQMVPHDMWDTDVSNPIVLLDLVRGDSVVPALAHASDLGWVYFLDRRTGAKLSRSDPIVPQHNMFVRPTPAGHVSYPIGFGGPTWSPPAYSPRTQLLYVLGGHIPTLVRLARAQYQPGGSYVGGAAVPLSDSSDSARQWGTVSAIDVRSGKIAWQLRTDRPLSSSGALATAGGLLFYGDPAGFIRAVDARDGRTLWQHAVGEPVEGPPVTFALDGQQYLAVATRAGLLTFSLPGSESR
jgi:PQQ-dependent dehydrogenase (methanol/ethanol family)